MVCSANAVLVLSTCVTSLELGPWLCRGQDLPCFPKIDDEIRDCLIDRGGELYPSPSLLASTGTMTLGYPPLQKRSVTCEHGSGSVARQCLQEPVPPGAAVPPH